MELVASSTVLAQQHSVDANTCKQIFNLIKITQSVFLIKKNLELTKNIIGYGHFQCIMVIVEAKAQLLAYLACFHQSRLDCNRTDTSVGGVFCNGYPFVFITITHEGTVKIRKIFDILQGNLLKVLERIVSDESQCNPR